ncbi:MAG: alpha-glucan family phosphorylase [Chloroflexi bacterium]|nr:alpha-glucan family phosphorylase [Chloroflexota bacterium]
MTPPKLPQRIGRLEELANNLWWSWHDEARKIFRSLDYPLWRAGGHNPVKVLREINPETLEAAANDPDFLAAYDSVMSAFDADMNNPNTWFETGYHGLLSGPVAYFSMEFAFHSSLPIYAGGLGVLAGDICKEAGELGVPMVAVGFMYPQGYFHQHISAEGWQEEYYRQLDFTEAPITPLFSYRELGATAQLRLANTPIYISVWEVLVGRTRVLLLDTNLEENPVQYRQLSSRLYTADREMRIGQEIVLGIGGVRVLRALNISPDIWHANEGHTSFMMLERVREEVEKGATYSEAMKRVQTKTVFTTHTPVPAGHDVFPLPLVEKYFSGYWSALGLDRSTFLQLGQQSAASPDFNMTALGLKLANHRYGVSQLHGRVTRQMWQVLWPNTPEDEVPLGHITNGVHVPSWIAPELYYCFEDCMGKDWIDHHDDPALWERLADFSDAMLWRVHLQMKRKLVGFIRDRMRGRWIDDNVPWGQILAMGALLDPEALTIVFARRFTEYKRPFLIFRDIERLKRIVNNPRWPVQIIFTGKSHPADFASKHLLHQVYSLAANRDLQGRIAFVEDYDMHLARYLVHGADVWLNLPRRLQEACGTSGMKAALNGILHMSVRDGWWYEAYNGANGWAVGPLQVTDPDKADELDAESVYSLLEKEVVPLYYRRDRNGVPHEWVRMMKESMRSIIPRFCARRMLKEYTGRTLKAAASAPVRDSPVT